VSESSDSNKCNFQPKGGHEVVADVAFALLVHLNKARRLDLAFRNSSPHKTSN
jgi:hypothetical protein